MIEIETYWTGLKIQSSELYTRLYSTSKDREETFFSVALKINLGTSRTHRKLRKHLRDAKMMTPVEKPKLLEELMTTKSAT